MVSIAPQNIPFVKALASAAGHKHRRDDDDETPTIPLVLASMSKKRVRFASVADKARYTEDYDSDVSMTVVPPLDKKKDKVSGSSMRNMFKMFVVNALDEKAAVGPPFPPLLYLPALWDLV
jgi:hypothetical protein